jgi:small subunit ribosomal protein S11
MGKKVTRTTAKKRKVIVEPFGNVYIKATFNNVIVSITNTSGHVIAWSSAGKMGFKGSKKNTPYAAQKAAEDCAKVAFDLGMRKATVFVKGPGAGRDAAVRIINNIGIEVTSITDTTPIPHNGCRPPKRRRV